MRFLRKTREAATAPRRILWVSATSGSSSGGTEPTPAPSAGRRTNRAALRKLHLPFPEAKNGASRGFPERRRWIAVVGGEEPIAVLNKRGSRRDRSFKGFSR